MRLITFTRNGEERLGAWINDDRNVVDLAAAALLTHGAGASAFSSMQSLIDAGAAELDRARKLIEDTPAECVFSTDDCAVRAPLPQPVQLRDCLAFPEHVRGCRVTIGEWMIETADDPQKKREELEASGFFDVPAGYYDYPVYYTGNRMAVFGDGDDIVWPTFSHAIDYELEWAAVIGKSGSQIAQENARDHIFGYTVLNDWSARDEQMKIMGGAVNLGPGSGKDFANTLGPCIVTVDEIADPYSVRMRAWINGELVSDGNTAGMHYRFEALIEHLSRGHTLYPGEVIGSGTVGGGCSLETGYQIASGDIIELEVEGIGKLRNRVLAPHIDVGNKTGFSSDMMRWMKSAIK